MNPDAIKAYHEKVLSIIQNQGHFIQGVNGEISYTVGLSKNLGFEIITKDLMTPWFNNTVLNITREYSVVDETTVSDQFGNTIRFGCITNQALINELAEKHCMGWETYGFRQHINKVYVPYITLPGMERIEKFKIIDTMEKLQVVLSCVSYVEISPKDSQTPT